MRIPLLLLLGIIAMGTGSCRKDKEQFDGPSLRDLFSEFTLLEPFRANRDSVNFANGQSLNFSARFNKVVQWNIRIRGLASGAEKVISGQSTAIDATNGLWNGSTTSFPVFRAENCLATLRIDGVNDSFELPIRVSAPKKNNGLLITDFENGINSQWNRFVQSGAAMDFNVKNDALAPQGSRYLQMAGTVNWDWLIGLIDFPATAYGSGNTFALSTNPDGVYFNCMIYGVPGTNPSLVLFQFKEDENSDGNTNAANEDQYDLEVRVNWTGWKLISVRYSDLPSLVNGQPATPKGNARHNPDKLGKISMLHLADPSAGFASSKIDYLIFTDRPLEP